MVLFKYQCHVYFVQQVFCVILDRLQWNVSKLLSPGKQGTLWRSNNKNFRFGRLFGMFQNYFNVLLIWIVIFISSYWVVTEYPNNKNYILKLLQILSKLALNIIKCRLFTRENGTTLCNKEECISAVGNFFYDSESFKFTKPVIKIPVFFISSDIIFLVFWMLWTRKIVYWHTQWDLCSMGMLKGWPVLFVQWRIRRVHKERFGFTRPYVSHCGHRPWLVFSGATNTLQFVMTTVNNLTIISQDIVNRKCLPIQEGADGKWTKIVRPICASLKVGIVAVHLAELSNSISVKSKMQYD